MTEVPHPFMHSLMLGPKSVRIDILDQQRKLCSGATGFVIKEQDGLFLYTCWHVVTGIDFIDPKVLKPSSRRTLVISLQAVEERQPGVTAIGGNRNIEIPLYDSKNIPLWQQDPNEREHSDLNAIGLHAPKLVDVVRMPIELDALRVGFESHEARAMRRTRSMTEAA